MIQLLWQLSYNSELPPVILQLSDGIQLPHRIFCIEDVFPHVYADNEPKILSSDECQMLSTTISVIFSTQFLCDLLYLHKSSPWHSSN